MKIVRQHRKLAKNAPVGGPQLARIRDFHDFRDLGAHEPELEAPITLGTPAGAGDGGRSPPQFRIQDSGLKIQDSGFRIQDAMQDFRASIRGQIFAKIQNHRNSTRHILECPNNF